MTNNRYMLTCQSDETLENKLYFTHTPSVIDALNLLTPDHYISV